LQLTGRISMATITVRDLDEEVRRRLKKRASAHDRSMEAEARAILTEAVADEEGFGAALLRLGDEVREGLGGVNLPLPPRRPARVLDLS
jgi:plasmid stability protein